VIGSGPDGLTTGETTVSCAVIVTLPHFAITLAEASAPLRVLEPIDPSTRRAVPATAARTASRLFGMAKSLRSDGLGRRS
jgi:hypothetical protein